MPETPDFLALARSAFMRDEPIPEIAEQLRQIWNARGAADLAVIDVSLTSQMGATASGPYVKNLEREIRKLDR